MKIHIITPVKNSVETALRAIEGVMKSQIDFPMDYTVYNDFSSPEATEILEQAAKQHSFRLVNLSDVTTHPSPNYLLILQMARQRALAEQAHLLIVESDVFVKEDTVRKMADCAESTPEAGMVAAVTTNAAGKINFPYEYALKYSATTQPTAKHLSFCCTLLTNRFLQAYDFSQLNPRKSWYDVFISHKSVELGFRNLLMVDNPVIHAPHSSRPWKQLKYEHPIKYYWFKFIKGLDKI